ncbi:MAG TPA: hypothetical protein VGG64_24655, partial [Pirellulales bacterium]
MRSLRFEQLEGRLLLDAMTIQFQYQNVTGSPAAGLTYPTLQYFPIRNALVNVSENGAAWPGPLTTSPTGAITLTNIPSGDQFTFVVQAKLGVPLATLMEVDAPATGTPQFAKFTGVSAQNIAKAADGTRSAQLSVNLQGTDPTDPAFAIFDTLENAAAYAAQIAPNATAGPLKVLYPEATNPKTNRPMQGAFFLANDVTNPASGGTVWAAYDTGMSFDTFAHEYGHYVAFSLGFFSNVATPAHDGSENFRYTSPNPGQAATKAVGILQAFNEGWADYFAVATKAYLMGLAGTDAVPGVVSGPAGTGTDARTSIVVASLDAGNAANPAPIPSVTFRWAASLSTNAYAGNAGGALNTSNTPGQGEDNEATVARVLYQLRNSFRASNGTILQLDDATLLADMQQQSSVARNGGATPDTLNALWNVLTKNQNGDVPSKQMFAFGDLFAQQNVGVTLTAPPPGTNWSASIVPTFRFTIPQTSSPDVPAGAPLNLLNTFTIRFAVLTGYDALLNPIYVDITQQALQQKGLPKAQSTFVKNQPNPGPGGPITGSWTPTPAQWKAIVNTVEALPGVFNHETLTWFVVAGDLTSGLPGLAKGLKSGWPDTRNYWSAAQNITVWPDPKVGSVGATQGQIAADPVTIPPGASQDVTVQYQFTSGSAVFGADFTVTNASGMAMAQSGTITVPADSDLTSPDEFDFEIDATDEGSTADKTATL